MAFCLPSMMTLCRLVGRHPSNDKRSFVIERNWKIPSRSRRMEAAWTDDEKQRHFSSRIHKSQMNFFCLRYSSSRVFSSKWKLNSFKTFHNCSGVEHIMYGKIHTSHKALSQIAGFVLGWWRRGLTQPSSDHGGKHSTMTPKLKSKTQSAFSTLSNTLGEAFILSSILLASSLMFCAVTNPTQSFRCMFNLLSFSVRLRKRREK